MEDEKSLLIRLKAGDRNAFKQIFKQYYSPLLTTAIAILKDQSLAKDVVQDVFFKIWNKRETLSFEGVLVAYLKRAVINQSINKKKSNSKTQSEEFIPLSQAKDAVVLENLAAQDLKKELEKALDTLPDKCRAIFVMRRLEGMKVKEIATALDISPKTVENQITKALKVLQKAMLPFVEKEFLKK